MVGEAAPELRPVVLLRPVKTSRLKRECVDLLARQPKVRMTWWSATRAA